MPGGAAEQQGSRSSGTVEDRTGPRDRADLPAGATGMNHVQLKRMKEHGRENTPLRRAVSDLTLDQMILAEAARENF